LPHITAAQPQNPASACAVEMPEFLLEFLPEFLNTEIFAIIFFPLSKRLAVAGAAGTTPRLRFFVFALTSHQASK
jgi:hypothetical protein